MHQKEFPVISNLLDPITPWATDKPIESTKQLWGSHSCNLFGIEILLLELNFLMHFRNSGIRKHLQPFPGIYCFVIIGDSLCNAYP